MYNVKGELDFLTAIRFFSQIIHFSVYKGKHTFLRKKDQLIYGEYLTIIKKNLNVPRVHTAALIES